jgi:hypothetical protein
MAANVTANGDVFMKTLQKLTLLMILLLLTACSTTTAPDANTVPPLTNAFTDSPGGFTFNYPDEWRYFIPAPNLLVLDQVRTVPDAADSGAGSPTASPAMTVQRSLLLTAEPSMRASLDEYLRVGPLQVGGWEIIDDISEMTLEGDRPALRVRLQGADHENAPPMRTDIYLTEADSGMVYVFVLSALVSEWDAVSPTLEAVLASVRILE